MSQDKAIASAIDALNFMRDAVWYSDNVRDEVFKKIDNAIALLSSMVQQPTRQELQAEGMHPSPCARFCESNAYEIEIRSLKAQLAKAAQPASAMVQPDSKPVEQAQPVKSLLPDPCDERDGVWVALQRPTNHIDKDKRIADLEFIIKRNEDAVERAAKIIADECNSAPVDHQANQVEQAHAVPDSKPAGSAAYLCPAGCGCFWRGNMNGTMSLFNGDQKSCSVCEGLPLDKLWPALIADNLFIENRGDGCWLVCVEKVYDSEDSARQSCRKWKAAYASPQPSPSSQKHDKVEVFGYTQEHYFDLLKKQGTASITVSPFKDTTYNIPLIRGDTAQSRDDVIDKAIKAIGSAFVFTQDIQLDPSHPKNVRIDTIEKCKDVLAKLKEPSNAK